MDKVKLVEQTQIISKKELLVPFSILFLILKEKFPNELKNIIYNDIEIILKEDCNSEEFLSCVWEESKQVESTSEPKSKMTTGLPKEEIS